VDVDGLARHSVEMEHRSLMATSLQRSSTTRPVQRRTRSAAGRSVTVGLIVLALLLSAIGLRSYLRSPTRGLPYSDAFASGKAEEWHSYGGTWEVVKGAMRNDSDERGAKLMTGSTHWRNYSIEADIMLIGDNGDAGLMIRSSKEEEGVDSYSGYYSGLRKLDDSLVLGRADHGWMETYRKINAKPVKVHAFQWYHLKLLAYECQIVASASSAADNTITTTSITDKDCVDSGRAGFRSYSSGGVWKNVSIREASYQDLAQMLQSTPSHETSAVQPAAADTFDNPGSSEAATTSQQPRANDLADTVPIANLRLYPFSNKETATVRGGVILTSPVLYVEDSTGGVSVPDAKAPPLKVGDEVEVTGEVHPGDFSSSLSNAHVQVLWARAPRPAISVTASQAATGAFDANFIELEGTLREKTIGPDGMLVFDFDAGPQSFRALLRRGRGDALFQSLKPNSVIRLRGVCVVDPAYTQNLTPFVLLLRSTDDVKVLAGPPWWSTGHLVAIVIGLLALALIINLIYGRAERWRLRAVLDERERLAHEMHDTLAQSFAGIGFQLEAIRNGITGDVSTTHQQLDLATNLVRHSHQEARRSIATLRPDSLEAGDLLTALESAASRMVEGGTVHVVATSEGDPRPIPLRIKDTVFRVGLEAIANSVRHAHPATISIAIAYKKNAVQLVVADDGIGFTQSSGVDGFGLRGIRKRAASISASLNILSATAQGTHVEITAPLPPRVTLFSWPHWIWKYLTEHRSHVSNAH
jgi:signal transduction histidine kinase